MDNFAGTALAPGAQVPRTRRVSRTELVVEFLRKTVRLLSAKYRGVYKSVLESVVEQQDSYLTAVGVARELAQTGSLGRQPPCLVQLRLKACTMHG